MEGGGVERGQCLGVPGEGSPVRKDQSRDILQQILEEEDDTAAFLESLGVGEEQLGAIQPANLSQAEAVEKEKRGNYRLIDYRKRLKHNEPKRQATGQHAVLLPKPLARISQRIASPKTQTEAGFPTCIAVSKWIAVGFAHSQVFVFNLFQELKGILGSSAALDQNGSVTSIDICGDPAVDWAAVGYQNGQVVVWDLSTLSIVKALPDIHKAPVVHVRFLNEYSQLISGDVTGEVHQTTFSYRLMYYSSDTVKILGGANGPIFAVAPLYKGNAEHPADGFGLLAVSSPKATFVLALKPTMKVVFKVPIPEGVDASKAMPYLTWRPAYSSPALSDSRKGLRVRDPVLAIAWGKTVQLVQAIKPTARAGAGMQSLEFVHLGAQYNADTIITGMLWLGHQTLVFITDKEQLRVLDPFAMTELENLDIRSMELVFHTKFSTSSSGAAKLCSFHHSFRTGIDCCYLLGMKRLYCSTIMSWKERVEVLTLEGRWIDALALCYEFYQGNGKAVVGLPQDGAKIRQVTGDKMQEILIEHVQKEISSDTDKKLVQLIISVSIDYCVAMQRCSTVLYDVLYPIFSEAGHSIVFLELLEPFILNDRLQYLNPAIMSTFVEHYRSKGMLPVVEQCIVHLDILSLDFHSVVKLCKAQNLTSALVYVYTKALHDYETPFKDLLGMVAGSQGDERRSLAYKLLLFVRYSLEGKAFPSGAELDGSAKHWVQAQLAYLLFAEGSTAERDDRIRLLAGIDMEAFAKVASAAMDVPSLAAESVCQLYTTAAKPTWMTAPSLPTSIPTHQAIANLLLALLVDQSSQPPFSDVASNASWPCNATQQGVILEFLATYFAKKLITLDDSALSRVLGYLTMHNNPATAERREDLLLAIIKMCSPDRYDEERVLLLSEGQSFVRVQEIFYLRRKQFEKAIKAYVMAKRQQGLVFAFVRRELDNPYILSQDKDIVKTAVLDHLTELVQIDSEEASKLVIEYLLKEHKMVLNKLRQHPQLQYSYLRTLMLPTPDIDELLERSGIAITTEMRETYIKLLCQFEPTKVCPFLIQNTDYRLDYCLSVCQHYEVVDATAYLLERTGDVSGALSLTLTALEEQLLVLRRLAEAQSTPPSFDEDISEAEVNVGSALRMVIELCQRNSQRLVDKENEHLWFQLLDTLVVPLRKLKAKLNRRGGFEKASREAAAASPVGRVVEPLTNFLREVLQSMMGFVPLRSIMEKIVRDHSSAHFNDFKNIIMTMMDTYNYERNILDTAKHLFERDVHEATVKKTALLSHSSRPKAGKCVICALPFKPAGDQSLPTKAAAVGVFNCGHSFHGLCLTSGPFQDECPACLGLLSEFKPATAEAIAPVPLPAAEKARLRRERLGRFEASLKSRKGQYALSLLPANLPAYEHRKAPPPPPTTPAGGEPVLGQGPPVPAATRGRGQPVQRGQQASRGGPVQAPARPPPAPGGDKTALSAEDKKKVKKRKKIKKTATKLAYYLA